MIGHNSNPKLLIAASVITQEHEGMLAAIEDNETRARRIGQVLFDLKPTLKEASINLTDFCKEHLPFGKSAAYEFISIAKGKVTLQEFNARNYSASAEMPIATELPVFLHGGMDFQRGLAHLRAMFWVDHGSEWEVFRRKLVEPIPSEVVESTDLPITKSDWAMATEAVAKMKSKGVLDEKRLDSQRSMVLVAIEYAVEQTDLYVAGYSLVFDISKADVTRANLVQSGDIKAAQALAEKQQVHADMLGMSLETVRMLHGLMTNHEANMVCLREGGSMSAHPLRDGYMALFPMPVGSDEIISGGAEDWCSEATAMTALGYAKDHEEASKEIEKSFQNRDPFWSVSTKASATLNRYCDDFTSKPKIKSFDEHMADFVAADEREAVGFNRIMKIMNSFAEDYEKEHGNLDNFIEVFAGATGKSVDEVKNLDLLRLTVTAEPKSINEVYEQLHNSTEQPQPKGRVGAIHESKNTDSNAK
jgi:hypothetical protein